MTGAVCSRRTLAPDGSAFVGTGFLREVRVRLSREDLAAGRDGVLDRGIDVWRQQVK
jgi:hypothetical protein